jgi:hypothetical protein
LSAALGADELVQASSSLVGRETLAVSRFGLWLVSGDSVVRWEWQHVSKARLVGRTLTVIAADELGTTDEGLVLLSDLPPMEFELSGESALTDAVHARVRRSVAASSYLPWPGAGGWVVLRRVPGRDGLTRQLRLDPGADAYAVGFLDAASRTASDLEAGLVEDS